MTFKLIFEKVGDVNFDFPYLCVYIEGLSEPFMELSISSARELEFVFYPQEKELRLSLGNIEEIKTTGEKFFFEALENYESSGFC